jgi:hypothetical protein
LRRSLSSQFHLTRAEIASSALTLKAMKSICNKCSHYETCKKPCYPVSRYLYEPGEPFEKSGVVYPLHKHVQHSACLRPSEEGKDSDDKIFSTELESPFKSFSPRLKTTGIFIHRFFLRDSFKDIAQMFGISESGARVLYSNAVQKILENSFWLLIQELLRLPE